MNLPGWISAALLAAEIALQIALALRVLIRRTEPSVTLAWIALILLIPVFGPLAYILVGENRLARKRAENEVIRRPTYEALLARMRAQTADAAPRLTDHERRLAAHAAALTGIPAQPGNHIELIDDPLDFLARLANDIDAAQHSVLLQFYIWTDQGLAKDVNDALARAARRGVRCLAMMDAVGSSAFIDSDAQHRLTDAGVRVTHALPIGFIRALLARADLRTHRKTAVIDGRLAYTGSQNLVDPRDFKLAAGVGQWIDAMVALKGPAAHSLAAMFLFDWEMETSEPCAESLASLVDHPPPPAHDAVVQLIPSGPGHTAGAFLKALVAAVYSAEREVLLTTPYFVPDDTLRAALAAAALRGVRVSLTVPRRSDIRLADAAARASFDQLLAAGVEIHRFADGLLHTKAITIDHEFAFIGTSNLDMRSFWLNFESMLAVYDDAFTQRLRALQLAYEARSTRLTLTQCRKRRPLSRLADSAAYAFSPVL
ncbi:MAG: cardiolipin synthase [Phycisphaeraceae bacterium]|nr:MAG: cardiolipin synthase [Phycisphaeraceae bacterium]